MDKVRMARMTGGGILMLAALRCKGARPRVGSFLLLSMCALLLLLAALSCAAPLRHQ